MLFCSQRFLVFFAAVFSVYWALPWRRARVWWLLAASFYFYASWNRSLALLIGVSTTLDYLIGLGLDASARPRMRKLLVLLSVGANLGLLCYFKYANFFLRSLEDALTLAGAGASLPVLKVVLPIGISFYTFEAINYTVDVYRRRMPAERNLAHFMLFITFFPHLIAGPIVRARDFLPQVERAKRWDWSRLHLGVGLFLLGVLKKSVIADRMAMFADPVYADPGHYGAAALWVAAVAYALQVYGDFSGYSDMALGSAHLLGYKLAPNFDMPYLSANIAEFWRRWHISLSTWFRDYVYFPLGGSRGGEWATARNLLVVMTLSGLWHGAAWNFVGFGVVQGVWLIGHRHFRGWCERRPGLDGLLRTPPGTALRVGLTFLTFCVTLVVFRSPTLAGSATMLGRLFSGSVGFAPPLELTSFWVLAGLLAAGHAVGRVGLWRILAVRLPAPALGLGYAAALLFALLLTPDGSTKAFIYFQF